MQIRSRLVAREFKRGDPADLHAGTPPLEALKTMVSFAANHKAQIFNRAHRRVPCKLPIQKAQRLVLVRLPGEDRRGLDVGKIGRLRKSCMVHEM